jgi:competence protein ComEC
VTTIPLNGGHAVYVQPRGAREWLIDCGDKNAVEFTLKPFLQTRGVNRLANLLLTHGDARQVGGVPLLMQTFPVRQAFASPVSSRSPRYHEALSDLEMKSKLHKYATNGFTFPPWTFLHPNGSDHFAFAGDNAVVTFGVFDGVRVLLVSNLGKAGQNAVMGRHPELTAEIVVAGLPGAGEPLATEWLAALRPKLIIIADSEFPSTRRATKDVARRLQRSSATVLFTRQAGAVTVEMRARVWRVQTARPVIDIEPDISPRRE